MGKRQWWEVHTSCRRYEQRRHIAVKITGVFRDQCDQGIGLSEGIVEYTTRKVDQWLIVNGKGEHTYELDVFLHVGNERQ